MGVRVEEEEVEEEGTEEKSPPRARSGRRGSYAERGSTTAGATASPAGAPRQNAWLEANGDMHSQRNQRRVLTHTVLCSRENNVYRKQILDRVNKNKEKSIYSEAVAGNEDNVYEQLCQETADVNERNPSNGRTVLHEAAANGHLTLAQMLLEEFGANIDCRTYLGKETPLHLAVSSNLRPMVYLLLNYGADPNIQVSL